MHENSCFLRHNDANTARMTCSVRQKTIRYNDCMIVRCAHFHWTLNKKKREIFPDLTKWQPMFRAGMPRAAWNPIGCRISWCTFAAPPVVFPPARRAMTCALLAAAQETFGPPGRLLRLPLAVSSRAMLRSWSFKKVCRRAHCTRLIGTAASLCACLASTNNS